MVRSVVLLFVLCFAVAAYAAPSSFSVTVPDSDTYVNMHSDWIFVNANTEPTGSVTLTLSTTATGVTITPSTLNYDANTRSASFRIISTKDQYVEIDYAVAGDLVAPGATGIFVSLRPVTIDQLPATFYRKIPTEPKQISIQQPSAGALTFTPSTTSPFTFEPASVVIPAGSLSGSFVVYSAETLTTTPVTIQWSITGDEAAYYRNVTSSRNIRVIQRQIAVTPFPANILPGTNSTVLYAYTTDRVNDTITITPKAADTVFSPETFTFTPGANVVPFTFVTTSPNYDAEGKLVTFRYDGPGKDDYYTIPDGNLNAPKKSINVVAPSSYVVNKTSQISIRIAAPVVSDITVYLYAANLAFSPTNVTFSGKTTSQVVDVHPIAPGPDSISFNVHGGDVDYYAQPAPQAVSVVSASFTRWYVPSLWVGVESDRIPVRINVVPDGDVTLTLSAPDVTFNPSTLTFNRGSLQQFFTVTPFFSNTDSDDATVSTVAVTHIVGGSDWSYFSIPADVTLTVKRRYFQIVWAPHLTVSGGVQQLFLQQQYTVWATANHVTDPVTVTPVNPYMTFSPAVLTFTAGQPRVKFTAVVNAAVGNTDITYVIGGQNGGLYTNIAANTVSTAVRTLTISSAVISPDSRVPGVLVTGPSLAELSSNHVYSIVIQCNEIPGQLTITPRSPHITFNPASIELSNKVLSDYPQSGTILRGYTFTLPFHNTLANFSLTPLSSGIHEVWFELGGSDANYYSPPDHTSISFKLDERVASQIPAIISAATLPAISTLLLLASFVLVIMM
jgi:hypothetical protein